MNKFFLICIVLLSHAYFSEAVVEGAAFAGVLALKIAAGIGNAVGKAISGRGLGNRFGRSVDSVEDPFLEASVVDADDCAKKMVCLTNAKSQESLSVAERILADMFGQDEPIDVTKNTVEFDLAAMVGRHAGRLQCKSVYARCPQDEDVLVEVFTA